MSRPSQKKQAKRRAREKRKYRQARGLPRLTKPQRIAKKINKTWDASCDQAEREGFPAETVYCMRRTGLMLTAEAIENGEATPEQIQHWTASIVEYRATHPEEQIVDDKGKRAGDG